MHLKSLYPVGACSGTTKEGKRCGIRDVFENGLCRHHGGEGELKRMTGAREKLKRRIAPVDRLVNRLMKRDPKLREAIERIRAKRPERQEPSNGGKPA